MSYTSNTKSVAKVGTYHHASCELSPQVQPTAALAELGGGLATYCVRVAVTGRAQIESVRLLSPSPLELLQEFLMW